MNKGTKTFLWIAGPLVLATGIIIFANRKRKTKKDQLADELTSKKDASGSVKPAPAASPSVFPLKKGSRNSTVKKLQEMIIATYGRKALPKYGADGDWGSETDDFMWKTFNMMQINTQTELDDVVTKMAALKAYNQVKDAIPWLF